MVAIEILIKGTVLLAIVFGLAAALRTASAATRHLVWAFGLLGLVSLPLMTTLLPWRLDVLPEVVRVGTTPSESGGDGRASIDRAEASASLVSDGSAPRPGIVETPTDPGLLIESPADVPVGPLRSPAALLLVIWGVGFALVAARWTAGALALRRCLKGSKPIGGPEWEAPLRWASDRLLLDSPVRLLVSDGVPMPLTAGVFRPVVVLPETALEWSPDRRRAVIVHELAHVRRKDALAHALSWGACALWWFHPLVWGAARNLRAEGERACDDLVLRAGTRASSYADHLLDIVCRAPSPRAPAPAMPLAQRSEFEGRMLRILSPDARRHGLSALKALAVAAAFASVAVPLAAIGTAPPTPSPGAPWASEEPSAARKVVDALLPEAGERFVAEKLLREEPREGDAEASASATESDTNRDLDSDAEGVASAAAGHETKGSASSSVSHSASPEEVSRVVAALSASLRDDDAEVRKEAARALGSIEDPRAVEALMRALRTDPDAGVRATAAWALGEIEDPRAVPALGEALRADQSAEVRAMAAWAMGEIESPQAVEYLRAGLRDSNVEVRAKAVWALGEIEDASAVPALSEALRDQNVEIRRNAAWALGQIESPTAIEPLSTALRDSDVEVRRKAVWALGEIEDVSALPALSGALRDADAEVRSTAVWAIGEIQPPSAPPALFDLAGDSSVEVRKHVAWALGEIEDPAGVPALRRLIQDANSEVRKNAIWALTEIHAPAAYESLVELLKDEDPEVRKAAAHALGDADWDENK